MKAAQSKKKQPIKRPSQIGATIKRWFLLGALGIISFFGLLSLFGDNGILDMFHLKSLHRSLQQENTQLLERQEDLRAEIARLQDPRHMEFLARDRLGLMRSNEVFIILDEEKNH